MHTAFYDPFEKETGIRIVNVAHESDPTTQFKFSVDSGSHIWDVAMVTPDNVLHLSESKNYLAPLDIASSDAKGILPGMLTNNWFGFLIYDVVMAYRSDHFAKATPTGWHDYWDTAKFPGRRGLLENALIADGVASKDVFRSTSIVRSSRSTRSARISTCGGPTARRTHSFCKAAKSICRIRGTPARAPPSRRPHR
ncbi:ABC transporter, periplasmic spermidine putrescine-binding protein PotD [Candidatus Paraburkholderia calva]|nr:ABC transporter, periplasmic spermidine putrescine-binding protein PotD [Candidatus Paraburkholderia calva]